MPPQFPLNVASHSPLLIQTPFPNASTLASTVTTVDESALAESIADSLNHQTFPGSINSPPAQGLATAQGLMAHSSTQQDGPNSQQQQLPPPQSHQLHTQHTSHLNTIPQQHPSYQQQPNIPYDRSYLDTLSDSPSLSFLSAHNPEPFNPNSILRDQSKSFSLTSEESSQFRVASGYNTARGGRPTQNGISPLDDGLNMFPGDIYSSQQATQGTMGLDRFDGDKSYLASLRNNSVVGSGAGPYGTGSTLPESQQVSVNKGESHLRSSWIVRR